MDLSKAKEEHRKLTRKDNQIARILLRACESDRRTMNTRVLDESDYHADENWPKATYVNNKYDVVKRLIRDNQSKLSSIIEDLELKEKKIALKAQAKKQLETVKRLRVMCYDDDPIQVGIALKRAYLEGFINGNQDPHDYDQFRHDSWLENNPVLLYKL